MRGCANIGDYELKQSFKRTLLASSMILSLDAASLDGAYRLLSDNIKNLSLVDAENTIDVTITRAGTFTDPRYGEFTLSVDMFNNMIKNFNENAFGQQIALDVAHEPNKGAAGFFKKLFLDGNKLRGKVELTPYGIDAIKNKGHIYLSAEIHPDFQDNETQEKHGAVLLGAGLVVRPCIKRLDPVKLSDDGNDSRILLSEKLRQRLTTEDKEMWKQLIIALKEKLLALKLDAGVVGKLVLAAEENLKTVVDKTTAEGVISLLEKTAEQIVGHGTGDNIGDINLSLNAPGMDKDAIIALMAEHQTSIDNANADKQTKLDAKIKLFADTIGKAEGIDDDIKIKLKAETGLVSTGVSDEAIVKFAEYQISVGQQQQVAKGLSNVGFVSTPVGSMQFNTGNDSDSIKLQGLIHGHLKQTSAFVTGSLKLAEDKNLNPFVTQVLALFDSQHAAAIKKNVLALAGETSISDTDLPVAFQREVIRESLSDLNILNLVQTYTDGGAQATTQIPYEERDVSGVLNDGIVSERQGIPKAKVRQKMDLGYMQAMKIAIDVSNEVMHLTQSSSINWDAWGRNVASASRLMRELVSRRIANEMQRVSDGFGAVAVVNESIASQLGGAVDFIKTAKFPVVRPFQQYDMQGNTVGGAENGLTIAFGATNIPAYDGSGLQTAGTYFTLRSLNLGYIAFVDEAGVAVTPNEATATISYSEATNVVKVDADLPANTSKEIHLNSLLQAIGARKARLSTDYFITPEFLLMSPSLNDECSNAEMFAAERKRDGINTNAMGDLATVKGLPAYGTNAPGIDLGDERIIMGVRAAMSYVIAKPWNMSQMIEGRDANGNLNATKEAYGEEYNCIKSPKPLHNRYTSILYYSVAGR